MKNEQLAALFDEDDIIALKEHLDSLPSYLTGRIEAQFFCINPLKGPGKLVTENIAKYRNILIEMDNGTIEEQWLKVEGAKLPWTTCVYSGGKSLHFIISLDDGIDDVRYYNNIAKIISEALGADTSTTNPNRLSRLAGSLREDNNVEQELIEVRERSSLKKLLDWMYFIAPKELRDKMAKIQERIMKEQLAALVKPAEDVGAKTVLPRIYADMLETGALHPECTSRHQSLVKFGVWLKDNWHAPDEVEELLMRAQVSLGIADREKDLTNLLKWLKLS